MTNPPPNNSESSRSGTLGFDEFIAILVAFATIGGILFWSLSRKPNSAWNLNWLSNSIGNLSSPGQEKPLIAIGSKNTDRNRDKSPVFSLSPETGNNVTSRPNTSPNQLKPPAIVGVRPPLSERFKVGPVLPEISGSSDLFTGPKDLRTQELPTVRTPEKPVAKDKDDVSKVISPSPATPTPADRERVIVPPKIFTDVDKSSWEHPFLDALSSHGMIDGYKEDNSFRPNQSINRAEFAALLNRGFNKQQTQRKLEFKDEVPVWAKSAIEEAISKHFLSGYPDKTFKPKRKIPRVEVLVAIASGLKLKAPSSPENILKIYEDADRIPKYAREKIAAATANNLVVDRTGKLKNFDPNREATRAEVAAMIHQALVQTEKLQPISSDKIVLYQR